MKASGENIRPDRPVNANTGRNETAMMVSEKKRAGPTSLVASTMIAQCGFLPRSRSRCLWAFSIITMAPSTMAPIAIAIPPSDMMLATSPWEYMTAMAIRMPTGRVKIATKAERRWSRKSTQTAATIRLSSSSFLRSIAWARPISAERS